MSQFPLTPWGSAAGVSGIEAPTNVQGIPPGPYRVRGGRTRAIVDENGQPLVRIWDDAKSAILGGSLTVSIPVNTSALIFSAPNTVRNFVGFRNNSTPIDPTDLTLGPNVYIEFGNTASLNAWIKLVPGQIMLLDNVIPQDEVFGYAEFGAVTVVAVQSSTPGQNVF